MKKSAILPGVAYRRKKSGGTIRYVIAIGDQHRPDNWYGDPNCVPDEPGVLYEQRMANGKVVREKLYLSSFADWAGAVVDECPTCGQPWPKPNE
jgi:hypothetical protein